MQAGLRNFGNPLQLQGLGGLSQTETEATVARREAMNVRFPHSLSRHAQR